MEVVGCVCLAPAARMRYPPSQKKARDKACVFEVSYLVRGLKIGALKKQGEVLIAHALECDALGLSKNGGRSGRKKGGRIRNAVGEGFQTTNGEGGIGI